MLIRLNFQKKMSTIVGKLMCFVLFGKCLVLFMTPLYNTVFFL